jgi:hypothetical protein
MLTIIFYGAVGGLAVVLCLMAFLIFEEEILFMIDFSKEFFSKFGNVIGWTLGEKTTITFDNQTWVYRWFKRVE